MSLDKPTRNKMMQAAPVQKEFHFASDGIYHAMAVQADSIEQATEIYHRTKQPINAPEQSPSTPAQEEAKEDVQ
jgi:hypothetical protein